MNRHTLASFHDQLDSLKSTSIPQVKNFFQKRIAKCINECKLQTINMKKSIGSYNNNSSSNNKNPNHHLSENEYEFGWGSDFDDLEDDDDDDDNDNEEDILCNDKTQSNLCNELNNINLVDSKHNQPPRPLPISNQNHLLIKSNSNSPRRPISEPPPPPLPKCPPPDLIEESFQSGPFVLMKPIVDGDNMYETMSPQNNSQLDGDYLLPNISSSSSTSSTSTQSSLVVGQGQHHHHHSINQVIDRPLPPIPVKITTIGQQQPNESLDHYPWFYDVERDEAENILRLKALNGLFLVRKSKRAGASNPYTLTLFYKHRIFHLNIRKRSDRLFALGSEKPKEKTFRSVADLIDYHSQEPIYLTSKGSIAGETKLISLTSSSCYK